MPIVLNGDGTVTGISVGGLPDGIVDTDMLANNAVTSAKSTITGGIFLQAVNATTTTQTSMTHNNDFYSTGLTGSITPSATSSKILIITSQCLQTRGEGNNHNVKVADFSLRRGSDSNQNNNTEIASAEFGIWSVNSSTSLPRSFTMGGFTYTDSPNTTSSVTYTTSVRAHASCECFAQEGGETGTMTLLEIAA